MTARPTLRRPRRSVSAPIQRRRTVRRTACHRRAPAWSRFERTHAPAAISHRPRARIVPVTANRMPSALRPKARAPLPSSFATLGSMAGEAFTRG
ncbi:hypothetical protein BURPSS13_P0719 [Burkholderia pseudomallei S13]|nr:hypothetical protein BURPSS13_P0719 [Burkholderia pseudomallei S13]